MGQAEFTRKIPGASKVENVDLTELQKFASSFSLTANKSIAILVAFASSVMTGIDKTVLGERLKSIAKGTNRNPPTDAEVAILQFYKKPSYILAAIVLSEFSKDAGVRIFGQELLRTVIKVLNLVDAGKKDALLELAMLVRDQMRFTDRSLPKKAVGSTFYSKGWRQMYQLF